MDRPRTSTPRGVCKYYIHPRGCFAGTRCKFLHGDPDTEQLTPYDKAKVCKFFQQGYCKRGDACWFRHVKADHVEALPIAGPSSAAEDNSYDNICSICFEAPTTYGLLGGCSHVFCISCIRQWRAPTGKSPDVIESGANKKCPMCRAPSRFITPTSQFYPHNTSEKETIITAYKASMGKVKCRHFEESRNSSRGPDCPFGKDCFYLHLNADGTPYVFETGASAGFRRQRAGARTSVSGGDIAAQMNILSHSLGILHNFFGTSDGNLSMTIDAIRSGLSGIGARIDGMASAVGIGSESTVQPDNATNERREDDASQRRRLASATAREMAGIERMADELLATISSIQLRASQTMDLDATSEGSQGPFWSMDDMPTLEPIADTDSNTDRAIFAEWMAHDPSSSENRDISTTSLSSQPIAVSGDNNAREQIHVGGSESQSSRATQTLTSNAENAAAWARLVLRGRQRRWTQAPTSVIVNRASSSGGNQSDDDDDLPALLSVSDSDSDDDYDNTDDDDGDDDIFVPSAPGTVADRRPVDSPITPPTPDSDGLPSTSPCPTSACAEDAASPPEFTTDGRGRVIAANPASGTEGALGSRHGSGQDESNQLSSPSTSKDC